MIIVFIIGMIIYCICPLPVQLIALIINIITPDSIPYIDEFIMFCSTAGKIRKIDEGIGFLEDNPVIAKALLTIIIVGIIIWGVIFIKTGIETIFF